MAQRSSIEAKANQVVDQMLEADGESLLQRVRSKTFKDHPNVHLSDYTDDLPEGEQFAMLISAFDGQVKNGGLDQWMENRYGTPETADQLHQHFAKYKSKYPALAKADDILSKLEDHLAGYDLELGPYQGEIRREAESAINEGDWERFDELMGGTEIFGDPRRLARHLAELTKELGEDDAEATLGAEAESVLENYLEHVRRTVDKLDSEYYKLGDGVLEAAESILKNELNMDPTLLQKALGLLKGAGAKVKQGVQSAGEKLKQGAQSVRKAGARGLNRAAEIIGGQ